MLKQKVKKTDKTANIETIQDTVYSNPTRIYFVKAETKNGTMCVIKFGELIYKPNEKEYTVDFKQPLAWLTVEETRFFAQTLLELFGSIKEA
jgi:hypothetical protein